jgi:Fe-S oxidoreductase
LLFVGCTPYFDVVLNYIRSDLLEIPRAAVRLLNAAGIRPKVLASERCCGHDAYWSGDDALFRKLAKENIEQVRSTGVKRIVAFCPECVSCWKDLYPQVEDLGIEIKSVIELVGEGLVSGKLKFRPGKEVFTYQDPCFFSKGKGVIEQPRQVIRSIGSLKDMPRSGEMSACCGTAGWVECDHTAKKVQMDRLNEAEGTGASALLTACPKCLIHLSCADRHHGMEACRPAGTSVFWSAARHSAAAEA